MRPSFSPGQNGPPLKIASNSISLLSGVSRNRLDKRRQVKLNNFISNQ